jgi:hypothetical protein
VGGVKNFVFDASLEVSRAAGAPWANVATGLLFFNGTSRRLDLKGEQLPDDVLNHLIESADLGQRSGNAETTLGENSYRLIFNQRAFFSI